MNLEQLKSQIESNKITNTFIIFECEENIRSNSKTQTKYIRKGGRSLICILKHKKSEIFLFSNKMVLPALRRRQEAG